MSSNCPIYTLRSSSFFFHGLALLTAMLWGSTFVASKVLLNAGMGPAEIMFLRFLLAYLIMLPFCPHSLRSHCFLDEVLFAVLGMSGGSFYFLAENTALAITDATSTVALLVCTTPVLTAVIVRTIWPSERLSRWFCLGSVLALMGVSLVVFNGVYILDDDPAVAALSVGASLLWAVYSIVLRILESRYDSRVITRKVFFWGVMTMLPVFLWSPFSTSVETLLMPRVWATLLFLSLVASLGCYLMWNVVVRNIGVVTAGNYLYFNPVVSLITAYLVLHENITPLAIVGCVLTIAGVWLCNRKRRSVA